MKVSFHTTLLALIGSTVMSFAQTLVLFDGEMVKGSNIEVKNETVRITVDGKELYYRRHEVEGYCKKGGPMMYLKRLPSEEPKEWNFSERSAFGEFYERVVDGEIRVYTYVVTSMGTRTTGPTSSTYLFAEKGDRYGWLNSNTFSNKDGKELLRSLVEDRPEFVSKLDTGKFKHKNDQIVELLREYNLVAHKRVPGGQVSMSSVMLYRTPEKEYVPIEVTIDDTLTYSLPVKRFFPVPLRTNALSKICLVSGTIKTCALIRSFPCYTQYFEINHKPGQNELKVELSNENKAIYEVKRSVTYK